MTYSALLNIASKDLSSEAEVETRLLQPLFNLLGYPITSIKPKKQLRPVVVASGSKKVTVEADFLLLRKNGTAKIVVEAKDPKKSVEEAWGQAASYALSYNRDKTPENKIKWLLISNGHITSLYQHDSDTPTITLQLSDFVSGSPPWISLRSTAKYTTAEEITVSLPFETKSPQELNEIFEQCHQLVWKKEKLAPTDAFFEFCKFIFLKIREDKERETEGNKAKPHELPMTDGWLAAQRRTSKHPVRDLFIKLRDNLEDEIKHGKKRIFEPNENFRLSASTCQDLIKKFEHINLSSIDEDLNGRMFEVFLNAAVRGKELGQYFTPRPLVDFMTRISIYGRTDLSNPPKVIDGSCGTAGFLIESMAHLLSQIGNAKNLTPREKLLLEKKVKNECLFGIEANERVTRIARINMYLHGDGGSHIFHGDGLDNHPEPFDDMTDERKSEVLDHAQKIKPSEFDIVLTNPPFSMSYSASNTDEEKILRQLSLADGTDTCKSNILFLQRYHDILKADGEMLIVLDDTVLNGSTHHSVRQWIFDKFIIIGVHSMPFNAFFKAKANIKTSVLHLRKKMAATDKQGHVFMSISNNIGHDNASKDTPQRNNLNNIWNAYTQWRRTGNISPSIKENQNPQENLECPEQIWVIPPEQLSAERIDSFFYAPELLQCWSDIESMALLKKADVKTGKDFQLAPKLSKQEKVELKTNQETLKYIEISDVTRYGLITKYIEGTIDQLPTRAEHIIKEGDVLMAINNSSRGTVVMVPKDFDGAMCTSGFYVIRPKNREEGLLLWYTLRSDYCRKQIYYLSQTASQPELKRDSWMNYFKIPILKGKERKKALIDAEKFQKHLSELLRADMVRLQS